VLDIRVTTINSAENSRLSGVKTALGNAKTATPFFYNNIFNIDLYSIYGLFLHAGVHWSLLPF
jgi:hypothetical protein